MTDTLFATEATMGDVKIQERGWAGHFCSSDKCRYRRNTLLSKGGKYIIVSSVGCYVLDRNGRPEEIGANRYYETMVFYGHKQEVYLEADVACNLMIPDHLPCGIFAEHPSHLPDDADAQMDLIHDDIVAWFVGHFDD
jgi:hypothetical protein